jgi:hypothetical protein
MPESLHLPMTYDRDSEIMQHATLSNHLKINIYFANLHASITAWGRSDEGGTGAPSDNGYTKIYSTRGAFVALLSNHLKY